MTHERLSRAGRNKKGFHLIKKRFGIIVPNSEVSKSGN
jgi:hypothetical protein